METRPSAVAPESKGDGGKRTDEGGNQQSRKRRWLTKEEREAKGGDRGVELQMAAWSSINAMSRKIELDPKKGVFPAPGAIKVRCSLSQDDYTGTLMTKQELAEKIENLRRSGISAVVLVMDHEELEEVQELVKLTENGVGPR